MRYLGESSAARAPERWLQRTSTRPHTVMLEPIINLTLGFPYLDGFTRISARSSPPYTVYHDFYHHGPIASTFYNNARAWLSGLPMVTGIDEGTRWVGRWPLGETMPRTLDERDPLMYYNYIHHIAAISRREYDWTTSTNPILEYLALQGSISAMFYLLRSPVRASRLRIRVLRSHAQVAEMSSGGDPEKYAIRAHGWGAPVSECVYVISAPLSDWPVLDNPILDGYPALVSGRPGPYRALIALATGNETLWPTDAGTPFTEAVDAVQVTEAVIPGGSSTQSSGVAVELPFTAQRNRTYVVAMVPTVNGLMDFSFHRYSYLQHYTEDGWGDYGTPPPALGPAPYGVLPDLHFRWEVRYSDYGGAWGGPGPLYMASVEPSRVYG